MSVRAPFAECVLLCACLYAVTAGAGELSAQVRVHGRVLTEVGAQPIEGARVLLTTTRGRRLDERVTGPDGSFVFFVRGHDAVRLEASRIGYRNATTPTLYFDDYDVYSVEIRLDVQAALLAPLEVTARASTAGGPDVLAGFEHRRKAAPGIFITRAEIEKRRPGYVTDLLASVPGISLQSSGRGTRRKVVMGRSAGNPECAAQVYIDGFLMSRDGDFAIDEAVAPQEVHGIEVYRGLSTVPADFLTPSSTCGVVVIWTRRTG